MEVLLFILIGIGTMIAFIGAFVKTALESIILQLSTLIELQGEEDEKRDSRSDDKE